MGFVAQHLQTACTGTNYAHIVGSRWHTDHDADGKDLGNGQQTLTVDYARLVTFFWTCCQDLRNRVATLEARLG